MPPNRPAHCVRRVVGILCVLCAARTAPAQTTLFHETFDKAEPVGWLGKNATTRLTATDQEGWRAALGANELVDFGLAEDAQGNRALRHVPRGSGGTERTVVTCTPTNPVAVRPGRPLTLAARFVAEAVNRGGPNPWNKLFRFGMRQAGTGFGYALGFDVQAFEGSPDNRLLRIDVYAPTNVPTVDDLRPRETGVWVGPRMSEELVGVSFRAEVTFVADGDTTRIGWELVNAKTGQRQTGNHLLEHSLAADTVLDLVRVAPTHWAHGTLDDLRVETAP